MLLFAKDIPPFALKVTKRKSDLMKLRPEKIKLLTVSNSKLILVKAKLKAICIDGPDEYLISIRGTYGSLCGYQVLRSISFETNKKLYGPYGAINTGTVFSHNAKGEVIIGFHGRASRHYITAIGVYAMPKALALASASAPTYI
ncbi:hypothetical protein QVD17_16021 [Tagetes erecta]|uniref:Jacalin-type lectin domain-containing protein n=1 Tax=Tagetes erecta TaxID=13708 RepID=A0AAD8NZ79_TARER|nr:hypothetical protein QVD17_16021 [Tagetes erecta]